MNSHNNLDSISVLNLSVRSYNALMREGIVYIGDLLNCSEYDISRIRNLGSKSVEEITAVINELNTYKADIYCVNNQKKFVGNDGKKYLDVEIEKLCLSVRAYNCLKSDGIGYYSQLIDKLSEELLSIPNMGQKSLREIEEKRANFKPELFIEDNNEVNLKQEEAKYRLFTAVTDKISIKPKDFFESFDAIYSKFIKENENRDDEDILLNKCFINSLYKDTYIKACMSQYIIGLIMEHPYGCGEECLLSRMPDYIKSLDNLYESLNDLLESKKIDLIFDNKFTAIYDEFHEGAKEHLNEKEYNVLIQRIQGKTLEDLGLEMNVSRERIRQIEAKAIKKLNGINAIFDEDKYSDIYKRYDISKEDFIISFNNRNAYHYLVLRYNGNDDKSKTSKIPLEEILHDKTIPTPYKKSCEKAIYKNYVQIANEYVPCTRSSIANYVLKTRALNDLTFEEFSGIYFDILQDINKNDDPRFSVMHRGYENRFAASNMVLWKYGKKIRYYNIESYDFVELFETLNLNQYKNIEFSTLKFFRLYPELMKVYDIRDEYELHNLLKKICTSDDFPDITFKRMPNMEFGSANRDNQVLELLIALAPIASADFASEYEKEYGVSANTVLANYMVNFDMYYYNGVYKIDFPALPNIIADKLKIKLNEDFFLLNEIRDIYEKEFPQSDKALLNPFSLKSIGFKVYSSYAIADKYSSATEYFYTLLTKEDVTNVEVISSKMKEIIAFTTQLYKLKADYEIIEFSPNKYIHFRKLNDFGITKEALQQYGEDVINFVGEGKYFTLFSLKSEGFSHGLDELGFEDWFYTSLLVENKEYFSYQRIGGNKVMIAGNFEIRFEEFLESIVFKQEALSIEVKDLEDILKQKYNINVNIWKLIQMIKGSSMYYDPISEKIFADYDTYYEVV
ncbi:MAG: RNA polymerase subunit sigma [Candidatus Wallbacteria bacterium HGW-Wallbacteria-1]|jgi:DNA-binding CsgD family transcriptional regulator|uniref:RNA polymerase subunit sigma n=1 Tax=Candidatus Wallbacteria bacterium HGW-Wallbacteria-1 TaxID=2013854 RepID=A0A2N1PIF5_9BACT|nr:MAG: RNA polymerase subunit sigma [Candidatus Wallbacteria bacterium HGW-Wallbacteria-1]